MKPSEVLETRLQPNQSVMAVINETGDKKTIWDRMNPIEVEGAKREFDYFKSKGYMAYKVTGTDGRRGEVLHAFDPQAERIIFAPAMQGGKHALPDSR
jgi:predicted dinucleotide-binding enzyme